MPCYPSVGDSTEPRGQYRTSTLDSGLDHGMDSGLNNGLKIWTKISIARGQRSCQITQQQNFDVT